MTPSREPLTHGAAFSGGFAAHSAAKFAHSLWGLVRAGGTLPQALAAIAAQRSVDASPDASLYERIAMEIRDNGQPLFAALQKERGFYSNRMVATLALANLSGVLFKTFVHHLHDQARYFVTLPPETVIEFPVVEDELREFFYYMGHLLVQRAAPDEVLRWLPSIFSTAFRGDVTYILLRFFDKGLRLSEALRLSRHFQDEELIAQIEASEGFDLLGSVLTEIPDWLDQRRRLEERLRYVDMLRLKI
jgi:type II secretory pathway component PulF